MKLLFDSFNKANLDSNAFDDGCAHFLHENFLVPQIFKPYENVIQCYETQQLDHLDFFIYPINFCDPVFHSKLNKMGKFLNDIDVRILDKLKNNKGIILIDASYEPFGIDDSLRLHHEIKKVYKTKNVFLNTKISSLYTHYNFFTNFPSFLEFSTSESKFPKQTEKTTNRKFCLLGLRIDKHEGGLNLIKWLKEQKLLSQGHISLSLVATEEIIAPTLSTSVLNRVKFNIVVEAWFNYSGNEDFPYLTEKIFRNIHYKKPFVLIGQHSTLKEFRRLGYKTYNEVFDESYDTEKDNDVRLTKVFSQIKRLINEPDDFWQKNKEKLDEIHKHNLDNYNARIQSLSRWLLTMNRTNTQGVIE